MNPQPGKLPNREMLLLSTWVWDPVTHASTPTPALAASEVGLVCMSVGMVLRQGHPGVRAVDLDARYGSRDLMEPQKCK